jgi:serine/threonine protein kinase
MSDDRLRRIEDIFHQAVDLAPEARSALLDQACGAHESLRQEVESLLAYDSENGTTFAGLAQDDAPESIAHYRISGKLGQGGMGAVYRATDTKLGREVAIKVLPRSFAEDADRIARFNREAKVLASLNHPNIAQIYGIEERALVMELVPGQTLTRPLPIETALNYAQQIAGALEAAHERGIIHRDLKPANVVVTPEGVVKLLDFGLAAVTPVSADRLSPPTVTNQPVRSGIIMGTAAYMSPEQAAGKPVDKRADVWSFGVVLWELLTGHRLFEADTVSLTLANVVRSAIDFTQLPRETPSEIRRLLRRCLDRDVKNRLRDIGEARIAIDAPLAGEVTPDVPSSPARQDGDSQGRGRWLWPVVAAALAVAVAALAFFEWRRGPQSDRGSVTRLTMELAPTEGLIPDAFNRPSSSAIAIAPDGNTVVFSALNPGASLNPRTLYPPGSVFKLYRRSLDQTENVAIPGTEGALNPFFSPDGQWIGFWVDGKLKKVSLSGGPPFTICDAPPGAINRGLWGASWGSTDTIVFAGYNRDLRQVPAKGGTPQAFLRRDPEKGELYSTPTFLPDGKTLLYTVRTSENWAHAQIVARLDTGEQRVLIQGGADARYVPTGHLLYMQNAVLMAVPFDARRVQLAGAPVAMLDGVMQAVNRPNPGFESGMGQFAASASGTLVYAAGGIQPPYTKTLLRVRHELASGEKDGLEFDAFRELESMPDPQKH